MFPAFLYVADSLQHNPHIYKVKDCCGTLGGLNFVAINRIKYYKFYVNVYIINCYVIANINQSYLQRYTKLNVILKDKGYQLILSQYRKCHQ